MHGTKRANFFFLCYDPYLFSLCSLLCKLFWVFGFHLLSTDNFVFIIKKIEMIRCELLQVISNICILGTKKLLLSFHGFLYSLIFSYLLITPKSVSPAPSSLSSLDSDTHLTTGHMHWDGHRHLILTSSSLTCFSSKIPQLTGTTIPSSIQGRNLVVNLDFSLSFTPHSRVLMLIFQVLFYFLNIYQIHPLLRSPAKLPSCRLL